MTTKKLKVMKENSKMTTKNDQQIITELTTKNNKITKTKKTIVHSYENIFSNHSKMPMCMLLKKNMV